MKYRTRIKFSDKHLKIKDLLDCIELFTLVNDRGLDHHDLIQFGPVDFRSGGVKPIIRNYYDTIENIRDGSPRNIFELTNVQYGKKETTVGDLKSILLLCNKKQTILYLHPKTDILYSIQKFPSVVKFSGQKQLVIELKRVY